MNDEVLLSVRWALMRMIELRAAGNVARFRVTWVDREGQRTYRLEIRRASGVIERPAWPVPLGGGNAIEETEAEEPAARPLGVGVARPAGFYWTRWEGSEAASIAEWCPDGPEGAGWYRTGSDEIWGEGTPHSFLQEVLAGPLSLPERP